MSASAPATPGSSSSSTRTRICKKLVVKGHASSSGASYTLFLKIHLPHSESGDTHVLLTDSKVKLLDAIVHRLDAAGAAPALSTSAATAANSLGIPLSIDHELNDSFIDYDSKQSAISKHNTSPQLNDISELPSVVQTDDGRITLRTSSRTSPRSKSAVASQHASSSLMITLHLFAKPVSKPPLAPYSVRLAVPVCLNNFLRFTVDESMDSDYSLHGMAVEVDPPILAISSKRKPLRRRSSANSPHRAPSVASFPDDEADVTLLGSDSVDESDFEQDDTAIAGPFHACEALVIRIAAEQAGDFSSEHPSRILPNALRAKKALCSIRYQPESRDALQDCSQGAATQMDFEATVELHDPYFPGLDREVQLYLQLDSSASMLEWQPATVDASRGIVSWSFAPVIPSTSSSPTQQPKTRDQGTLGSSPLFESADLIVLPDPNQQSTDDEDLLSVAPPKGLNDADFDFSLDNAAAASPKHRRFSLQSSVSAKNASSAPQSEPSDLKIASHHMLAITFSLLPVLQSTDPILVWIRGTTTLDSSKAVALQCGDYNRLPRGFLVPAAETQRYKKIEAAPPGSSEAQPEAALDLAAESLDDSRETVQHSGRPQDKSKITLHAPNADTTSRAATDEVLRQALALIAAHNESLDANRVVSQREHGGGINWVLRASHLLWTLFLTALVFMLFNAGQTANRALSAKVDELSRIIEALNRVNNTSSYPVSYPVSYPAAQDTKPIVDIFEPVIPASSVVEQDSKLLGDDVLEEAPTLSEEKTSIEPEHLAEARSYWSDSFSSEGPQTGTQHASLSFYASNWLQDMLRMPVVLIRRLLSILTGA